MFDDMIIVQSALSAFNNAALASPAFLWSALLTLPLYYVIWMFGGQIADFLHWTRNNITTRTALWTVIITIGWVILFGGNYGILRDNISILPFVIAIITFVSFLLIGTLTRNYVYWRKSNIIYVILVMLGLGISDTHVWWGPFLQIGAAAGGLIIGRYIGIKLLAVPWTLLILYATGITILMQPEYFRFGQLGNLTWFHLLFIMIFAVFTMMAFAVRNITPHNRIHQSAYIKLKWLGRFIAALGVALFVMTESIPVFLGTSFAVFMLVSLSLWHLRDVSRSLGDNLFALSIISFGVLTAMPAISAVGIVFLVNIPHNNLWRQIRSLL